MKYDIYNPTTARRIIHTGVEGVTRPVEILPHTSVDGVELADHIARDLIERSERDHDGELRISETREVVEGAPLPGIKMGLDEDRIHIIKAADQPEAKKAKGRR